MKMIKRTKTIAIVVAIIMLFAIAVFTGCQKNTATVLGITQIVDHPSLDNCRNGSIDRLEELGYKEGEDFVIKYQSAQGDPSVASTIAGQFVSDKVDIILAISTPSAQAAYGSAMSQKIPVVFSGVTDPVVAELASKDGSSLENITGTSDQMPMSDEFELIKTLMPNAKKVGILHNTSEVNSDVQLKHAQEIARQNGMEVVDVGITSTNDIASALDVIIPQIDIMLNLTDNMVVSALPLIIERTMEANIPVIGSEEEQVKNGALASAGIDYYNLGRQSGEMIAKILDGTPAKDIPIEKIKDVKLTVNMDAASKLGIEIPNDILDKSDVVNVGEES